MCSAKHMAMFDDHSRLLSETLESRVCSVNLCPHFSDYMVEGGLILSNSLSEGFVLWFSYVSE